MTSEARFIEADRSQTRWDFIDLEALLPTDHRARIVMSFVESLDLSELYDAIKSREGEPGRPPPDPAVLLALWLYATIEGVGSARHLERLAQRDVAYRWIAGGVPLNYHGLSDFRVGHVEVLDRLLSESVTALIGEGLVSLAEIAIDGTKVRANASNDSFKTDTKLARVEAAVEQRLTTLKAEIERDPEASSRRKRASQERAAREVKERAVKARAILEQVRAERKERAKKHPKDEAKKSEAKVSLSDPEARKMRFPDGAVRAAYNAQIAAAPSEGIILSVEMTDRRNDAGLAAPMVDDIIRRYGKTPEKLLVDTHYATSEDIAALAEHAAGSVQVFAPTPTERDNISARALANRKSKRAREPESVKEWRSRMGTQAGQEVYRLRKLIERINANLKNHGFGFLYVRGLIKTKAVILWHALANNLMAGHRLRKQVA
ncbi:IS1182 family transposase [Methyloceanibacter sp.]|uniref:IS1182 family transposase n=1 Tax=Methyloceanibacter sp. TaxID=1965321 RepID=UPI003D6C9FA7